MFIQVRLLKGFPKPLLYKMPETRPLENLVGRVVHVPIQKRTEHALVIAQFAKKPTTYPKINLFSDRFLIFLTNPAQTFKKLFRIFR